MTSDVTDTVRARKHLKRVNTNLADRLKKRNIALEESNTAMRVLLRQQARDLKKQQTGFERNILLNTKAVITPLLEKLKSTRLNNLQKSILETLADNISNMVSPFISNMTAEFHDLSPMEIRIAALIREGKINKEIAEILGVSKSTVLTHRHHLRKKLGLVNRKVNLRSHLNSLQ